MHDPQTLAFDIYLGKKQKKNGQYRDSFITIWHKDPEVDGTDDSCGWFIRPRHANREVLSEIKKEFDYNFKNNYWFDKVGLQVFSTPGTMMQMYLHAAWIHFKHNRRKTDAFMRKYCADIIMFAENPHDCGGDSITGKHFISTCTPLTSPHRFEEMAGMIYSDILRKERRWYQHPKWHIHHWRIQFHPFQQLKRRYWDKCCVCGKRGFKSSAIGSWGGKRIWHQECDNSHIENKPNDTRSN